MQGFSLMSLNPSMYQRFQSNHTYKNNHKNLSPEDDLESIFLEEINKKRTFHEGQLAVFDTFFEKEAKYIFMRIGRKGAKTTTNITCAWRYCLQKKNRSCYIIAPTQKLGEEIYWDEKRLQWCDLPDSDLCDLFVKNISQQKLTITFVNGSTIKIQGTWRDDQSRGTQPNLMIVDEIKDCNKDYLDASDPNLAAKADARCIMSGTPPNKLTHFHEWENRISKRENGYLFKYSSYINTALPHLKGWLDDKHAELKEAGKEDEWFREYMAEDCFSSEERILPDIHVQETEQMIMNLKKYDPTVFDPILGITITMQKMCIVIGMSLQSKYDGVKFWILETQIKNKLWDISYNDIYTEINEILKKYSAFTRKWKKVVYDETESFVDVIPEIITARKDLKWQNRGIPLLKELILSDKAFFSSDSADFAIEAQNLLKGDKILDYPTVSTMAMLSNEFYQSPSLSKKEKEKWDKFKPLRDAGIICNPSKGKRRKIRAYNWD